MSSNGVDAKPGSLTNIGVKKTFIYKAHSPFSECDRLTEFTSELYELIVGRNVTYRQVDCFGLCLQKMIVSACRCYSLKYLKLVEGVGPCLSMEQLKCVKLENDRFLQSEKSQLCGSECPLECNSVDYEFSYSSSDFPTEEYFDSFKLNSSSKEIYLNGEYVSFEAYRKSFIGLNIYYPYLKYTEIVEVEKYSLIDLLSNIGGTLGLFLGISFLSFVEIFEILFEIFLVLVRN
jgi:amiloride-sensitive sodium channel subunit alpha/amiloride-sensitive sodium channel subunit gamma